MLTKMVFAMLTCSLILTGCAVPIAVWSSDPTEKQVENPFFRLAVTPQKDMRGSFVMFRVEVFNKTDDSLEIDWNESSYMFKGKSIDRLVFSGIDPKAVKSKNIPMEKITPGQTIIKNVGSLRFASFLKHGGKSAEPEMSSISFGPLPAGYNGVQLVVRTEDKAIVEQIQIRLTAR